MKKGYPPLWLSALILALLLFWKMLGAPVSAKQFQALETPFWQARVLLPSRLSRVLLLWMPVQTVKPEAVTLPEDGMDTDDRELARLMDGGGESPMIAVYVAEEDRLVSMTLEGYACGVVAAEVPAAYHMEALKAQAVAARTRAIYQMQNGGCPLHESAAICTDSAHCQGYATLVECREKWGEEYGVYRERIMKAVAETADELLTYGGEPITVMYHAISGGTTEAAQTVFAQTLPYLISVDSAGEEDTRGFYTDTAYTFEEAARLLSAALPELDVTAEEVRQSLIVGEYTPTGRVKSVLLNGHEVEATAFRKALGLRSTWFTLSTDAQSVTFHQRGYGHGVGMSQAGANSMAAAGSGYRDILAHYYPGTQLEKR